MDEELRAELLELARARHFDELARIVEEHGWPGSSRVAHDGAAAAAYLAAHAGLGVQRRVLPLLAQAVAAGEASGAALAPVVDAVRVADGLPQLYGTQVRPVGEAFEPLPLADPDTVDERRAELGLGPLAAELALRRYFGGELPGTFTDEPLEERVELDGELVARLCRAAAAFPEIASLHAERRRMRPIFGAGTTHETTTLHVVLDPPPTEPGTPSVRLAVAALMEAAAAARAELSYAVPAAVAVPVVERRGTVLDRRATPDASGTHS